ncbi:MAG: hypothetical protein JWM16_6061 [Verrucomicrobiales bacterium]|nr:hypothetical protein [Verrucomicrobiales bacterium]
MLSLNVAVILLPELVPTMASEQQGLVKMSKRKKLWLGLLLLMAVITVVFYSLRPPSMHLELVSQHPSKRVQFVNDSGRSLNFFFFTEVKSNGAWAKANPQPEHALFANHVKANGIREFELEPTPAASIAWRLAVNYQPALPPWYLRWAKRVGVMRNYEAHYFDGETLYMEFPQPNPPQ